MKANDFNARQKYSEASGVCTSIDENISIRLNEYGYYEEIVENGKELNPFIENVSPNLNCDRNESVIATKLYKNIDGINYDARIGYYLSLYAGYVLEGKFRENASSGGMGTWIFKELFEKKLIDGVIHVKQYNCENNQILFHYDISRSIDEIKAGAKTKYYPVELSRVIKEIKEFPGRYAIIGIPSFIMAIRLLSEVDEVINDRIKYTIGLICGHQKSSKFAESMAWQVGIKPGNLRHIDFRKKFPDKPANYYGVEITGIKNGEEVTIIKSTSELLGQNWGQGYFKLYASDFTDDVMNETADMTIGDAWLPQYTKDSKGNNVIIVRHPELDQIIKDGINHQKLNMDIIDKETIFRSQAAHYRHTHDELAYRLYKKDKTKEWRPQKRVEASNQISYLRRKVQDLREEISTQSHMVYKRAVEQDEPDYFLNKMGKLSKKYENLYRVMRLKDKGLSGLAKAVVRRIRRIFGFG